MHWPGESLEKAILPDPDVRVTKNSIPAILRFTAPGSFLSSMFSCVCFHSRTWCSNITAWEPISICSSGTSSPRMW